MKLLFITLWGCLSMLSINTAQATEVKIKVSNINIKRGGNITVMIFGKEGFPKNHKKAIATQTKMATKKTLEFKFPLNMSELAVKILHDENGDGKVTKNWTGIFPKEGLGFSNGQRITMTGPPNYKKSKLVKEQFKSELVIPVRYPRGNKS